MEIEKHTHTHIYMMIYIIMTVIDYKNHMKKQNAWISVCEVVVGDRRENIEGEERTETVCCLLLYMNNS